MAKEKLVFFTEIAKKNRRAIFGVYFARYDENYSKKLHNRNKKAFKKIKKQTLSIT